MTVYEYFHAHQRDGRAVLVWTHYGENEPMIWICRFYNERKGQWGFALCHYTQMAIKWFEGGEDMSRIGVRQNPYRLIA